MNDIIKMSIITSIQAMSSEYSFETLWAQKYSDLEILRDEALIEYNLKVQNIAKNL